MVYSEFDIFIWIKTWNILAAQNTKPLKMSEHYDSNEMVG